MDTSKALLKLDLSGHRLEFEADVPKGEVTVRDLLPILREFTHAVVDLGVNQIESEGKSVSCQAGCGACCCQLVPVNRSEAFVVRDLVENLPAKRKTDVLGRFAAAKERLRAEGVYDALLKSDTDSLGGHREFGIRYFQLGISCPFLEEQSCSIYPDRPLKCREYLVTSPAEFCSKPQTGQIEGVPVPTKPANAAMRVGHAGEASDVQTWIPLIVALDWAATHTEDSPKPGTQLFEEYLSQFLRAPVHSETRGEPKAP